MWPFGKYTLSRQAGGVAAINAEGQVRFIMNFWVGLLIGLIVGANIGVVVAGLLASLRREEHSMGKMEMQPAEESALMGGDSEYSGSRRDRAKSSKSIDIGPRGTP